MIYLELEPLSLLWLLSEYLMSCINQFKYKMCNVHSHETLTYLARCPFHCCCNTGCLCLCNLGGLCDLCSHVHFVLGSVFWDSICVRSWKLDWSPCNLISDILGRMSPDLDFSMLRSFDFFRYLSGETCVQLEVAGNPVTSCLA